jgi:uncharacterized protein (DUF362 family)/NAD-dependent dihydropyrimidine dehydrogenase PreA subunit
MDKEIALDNRVYIVRCTDYHHAEQGVHELLAMMGGMEHFAKPGDRIVLKVNLLRPGQPEEAVSTHPAVTAAVASMAKACGAIPMITDSPGAGYRYTKKMLEKTYRISGMQEIADTLGIELNRDTSHEVVSFPDGRLIKRFEVITPVLKADVVFNLCKLKTHSFMHMTGAVKNNFGIVPGLTKPGYHGKLRDTARFADMLLDLLGFVAPQLSIMDAIVGMEGEGPGSGRPREVGLLLASRNALALDVVASEIIGIERNRNPILLAAERRGLGPNRLEEVDVVGPTVSDLVIPDFELPATVFGGSGVGGEAWWIRLVEPLFRHAFSVKPVVSRDRCIACGACRDACPMKVITIVDGGHATIDHRGCIRCYCCHEMCPENAIELHQGLFYRIANR